MATGKQNIADALLRTIAEWRHTIPFDEYQHRTSKSLEAAAAVFHSCNCMGHKHPYAIMAAALTTANRPGEMMGIFLRAPEVAQFLSTDLPVRSLASIGEGLSISSLNQLRSNMSSLYHVMLSLSRFARSQPRHQLVAWIADTATMIETDLRALSSVREEVKQAAIDRAWQLEPESDHMA